MREFRLPAREEHKQPKKRQEGTKSEKQGMRGRYKWLEMQNNSRESLTHISPGKYLMRAPRRGE